MERRRLVLLQHTTAQRTLVCILCQLMWAAKGYVDVYRHLCCWDVYSPEGRTELESLAPGAESFLPPTVHEDWGKPQLDGKCRIHTH